MKMMMLVLLILLFIPSQIAYAQTPTPLTGPYPEPIFQQNIELVIGTLILFVIVLVGLVRFRKPHQP